MGKHSLGGSGSFWASLFLSVLKWAALAVLPVVAAVGIWNVLNNPTGPTAESGKETDSPTMATPSSSPSTPPPSPSPSPSASPSPQGPRTQILNGTDKLAVTAKAEAQLRNAGYDVVTTGNTSRPYDKTTVFFQPGSETQGKALATLTGATVTQPAPDNLDEQIPLALVIGADY